MANEKDKKEAAVVVTATSTAEKTVAKEETPTAKTDEEVAPAVVAAPEKTHRCRGMKDHKCRIAGTTWIIEKGKEYPLPGDVAAILGNAGIVMKL